MAHTTKKLISLILALVFCMSNAILPAMATGMEEPPAPPSVDAPINDEPIIDEPIIDESKADEQPKVDEQNKDNGHKDNHNNKPGGNQSGDAQEYVSITINGMDETTKIVASDSAHDFLTNGTYSDVSVSKYGDSGNTILITVNTSNGIQTFLGTLSDGYSFGDDLDYTIDGVNEQSASHDNIQINITATSDSGNTDIPEIIITPTDDPIDEPTDEPIDPANQPTIPDVPATPDHPAVPDAPVNPADPTVPAAPAEENPQPRLMTFRNAPQVIHAEYVDAEDENKDLTTIMDEEVPLADVPATGDISLIWAAISGLSAGGMLLINKKREDEK